MPDHSHQPYALPAVAIVIVAILLLLILSTMTATVTAQDTPTQEPTSEFSLNLPPTYAGPTATTDPNNLISLSGVGGQAVSANVAIRSGPGLDYRRISYLRARQRWIDIVGWNGWDTKRTCTRGLPEHAGYVGAGAVRRAARLDRALCAGHSRPVDQAAARECRRHAHPAALKKVPSAEC